MEFDQALFVGHSIYSIGKVWMEQARNIGVLAYYQMLFNIILILDAVFIIECFENGGVSSETL